MSRKNNLFKLDLLVLAVLYHGDCYGDYSQGTAPSIA